MTPRSFWAIVIKILGIYIIIQSLSGIPAFIFSNYSMVMSISNYPDGAHVLTIELVYYIFTIGLYLMVLIYSLFKTDWIIDKLKLDKGFEDERFEFNIHRSTIIKVVVMLTGGLMFVNSFPWLCRYLFGYYEQINEVKSFKESTQASYIIIYFLQTFIGYFMLTCSRMIVNFIELKRKKPITNISEGTI